MVTYKKQLDGSVINTVKIYGTNSARVQVPTKWLGKTVKVILIDQVKEQEQAATPDGQGQGTDPA